MNAIKGLYRNGQIILSESANWPEGTEVLVEPMPQPESGDEDWPTDQESIARWILEFESIPPLEMTPEEEGAWKAALQAQKDFDLARWEQDARRIEGLFP